MHFSKLTAVGLAALAAKVSASSLEVNNYCSVTLWVTLVNSSFGSNQIQLPSGQAFVQDISGSGNSLGLTKSPDYWNSQTPKLILGTTIDNAQLWWSVSHVDGDPFQGQAFNVTSPDHSGKDVCGSATTYESISHSCKDADFTLTLNPCYNE